MLTYNEYKKWSIECDTKFYNKIGSIFEQEPFRDKRANRIFLYSKIENDYLLQSEIKDFLTKNGYSILNEIEGTCLPAKTNARDKKSPIKIGKVLNKLEPELLKQYTDKRTLHIKDTDDYVTVISRHPYDIVGVPTRRKWTSCLDLHEKIYNGEHLKGKFTELLRSGGLAAYLVNKDDKNINDPISRINISYNLFKDTAYSRPNLWKYETQGKFTPSFEKIVADWIIKANKLLQETN